MQDDFEMRNHKQLNSIQILIIILLILIVILGLVIHNDNTNINTENNSIRNIKIANIKTRKQMKYYKASKYMNYIKDTNPNLNNVKQQTTYKIKKAVNIAYNGQFHNTNDFNVHKNQISNIVGQSLSNTILNITHPRILTMSSKAISPALHVNYCDVTYGKYNLASKDLPMTIFISYQTPKYAKASGNIKGQKVKSYTRYSTIEANEIMNKGLTVVHSEDGENKQQADIDS